MIDNFKGAYDATMHLIAQGHRRIGCILGLSNEVRNGFSGLSVTFTIKGDAPAEKLREIVQQACARSAVAWPCPT